MLTLETIQARMRKALLLDSDVSLDDFLGEKASRFDVHRKHFTRSLATALQKTFPAIVNLVDARFFAYAADAFVRAHPPKTPCLFEYGGELPAFFEAFPACSHLPYLGDVARMEWAMHEVFHAADAEPQRILSSHWPVDAIWRLAMGRAQAAVDMNSGGVCLLFYRDGDEVRFKKLSPAYSPVPPLATKGFPHVQ